MRKIKRWTILVLAVALCLSIAACGGSDGPSETQTPAPTQAPTPAADTNLAPDFSFTKDGTTVKLSDFYGKPTVLNFYCTWCGPCMYEMPFMQSAYERYGSEIN